MADQSTIQLLCRLLMKEEDWVITLALEGLEKALWVRRSLCASKGG